MASIQREVVLNAPVERVWDAVRDVGALHTRLVPGFVTATKLEPGARIVTFANGLSVRELIVDVDDRQRRICWAAVGGSLTHHNASFQVFEAGAGRTRGVWIADLLPDDAAATVTGMIEQGLKAMEKAFGPAVAGGS